MEQRGRYYEKAGTLRDMVPNHIFQLISLTAMEPPVSFDADVVRDEQAKILKALSPMTRRRGADTHGARPVWRGVEGNNRVPGYRAEPYVAPESRTETFVAMKLFIDNWRWADVPFYLRTGKRLAERSTKIAIQFKRAPFQLFRTRRSKRWKPTGWCSTFNRRKDFPELWRENSSRSVAEYGAGRDEIRLHQLFWAERRAPGGSMVGDATLNGRRRGYASSRRFWTFGEALPAAQLSQLCRGRLRSRQLVATAAFEQRGIPVKSHEKEEKAARTRVVFLFDVDNTLLNNR